MSVYELWDNIKHSEHVSEGKVNCKWYQKKSLKK